MTASRIVVGVDGSPTSREAMRWAVCLGRALGDEVVAVHSVGLLEAAHDPAAPPESWRAGVRDVVEHTWCAPLEDAGVPHRIEVVDGHPVDVLLRVADREDAALVVLGARGVGSHEERALGSTSLRVLQAARAPTLVVPTPREAHPAADGEVRLRHILVGTDRSAPSLAALGVAADIAATLGGSLSVLEAFAYEPPFPLGPTAAVTSRGEEQALDRTAALVEEQVRDIRDRGVAVQVVVRSGAPAPTLLQLADDVDADLIVVGSRGRGDPAEPLLGSVARTVAAHARRATLVVPAAAGRVRLAPGPS